MTSSYSSGSQAAGKKSSPTPSTRYGRPEPPENTEPSGSAAMMRMSGFCALRKRAVPVIDPHVPAPATKWVIRPAVCAHSSGPVVFSWASGLVGLAYWLGRNALQLVGQPLGDASSSSAGRRARRRPGTRRPRRRRPAAARSSPAPPCRSSRTRTGSRAGRRRWPARRRCCRSSARRSCRPAAAGRRARRRGSSPAPAGPSTTRRGCGLHLHRQHAGQLLELHRSASCARAACCRSGRSPSRRSASPRAGRQPCAEA